MEGVRDGEAVHRTPGMIVRQVTEDVALSGVKEPQVMAAQGMEHAMFAYIREAMQAAGLELSA